MQQHAHLEMKTCPFNAKHIIPKVEYQYHLVHCSDRAIIDQDMLYRKYILTLNNDYFNLFII